MARCAICGLEIEKPLKTWTIVVGKRRKTKITFGTFLCERCRRKFKASLGKEELKPEPKPQPYPPPHVTMYI
ncbi:MAG: hypothetical protein ACXQTV_01590 [Candidatus Hecatellaceae archaeon]